MLQSEAIQLNREHEHKLQKNQPHCVSYPAWI